MKIRCTACSYRWLSRLTKLPKSCPRCHSYRGVQRVTPGEPRVPRGPTPEGAPHQEAGGATPVAVTPYPVAAAVGAS